MLACGARTNLVDGEVGEGGIATPAGDGAIHDGASDARRDGDSSVVPSDAAPPPIDASLHDVAVPNDCPDAGATLVYVLTGDQQLFSFYPPTRNFRSIGTLDCPATGGATPWSMAVDRQGTAYSVYNSGSLYRVSTKDASCSATNYVAGQQGFTTFGMSFVANVDTNADELYVADANDSAASTGLGRIDTTTMTLSFIGSFSRTLQRCELSGTGDGRLFAFCVGTSGSGSTLNEIDKTTGIVLASDTLVTGRSSDAFAIAFWGGSFWIFTGDGTSTTVTEYDPGTKKETTVAVAPISIVGAGVSTCAPL